VQKKGSILVIDDERSMLGVLEQYLAERGYEIETAENGAKALDVCASRGFDVALVDLKLPDHTGLELIAALRERHPSMRCIIMTAFASLESTIEALKLNAFDYILKPFDLVKIGEVVDAAYNSLLLGDESTRMIGALEKAHRQLEESKEDLNRKIVRANEELAAAGESIKKHVTRLKMLYQMGRDISSNEDWGDSLDRFLMALCKYLESEGAGLLLFSDFGRKLNVRTSYHLEGELLDRALDILLDAHGKDICLSEVFNLESCTSGSAIACLAMKKPWEHTVIPLLYKGRWLGFLLLRKVYATRLAYLGDYHFISTIQTILTEEVANAVNISRLRELKNFNETVLENINSGVLTTDNFGRIVFLNGRATEILGDLSGQKLGFDDLFMNPFGSEGLFEYLVFRERKSTSLEGILKLPGGGTIPVRLNTTVVEIDDYHGKTVVAVFEDLTEQKTMEKELRRADRLRSLGELSAGVAHEIRNPLTGIATTVQVLREKLAGDDDKVKYLSVILDEIKRLDDIIDSLLHFAKPLTTNPAELHIGSALEDAMGLLADEAAKRDVSLRLENRLEDDLCVLDGDQIKQVALNLMLNGIQACGKGGDMTVSVRESRTPAYVEIEFADSGEGIPPETADKLYNPFFTTRAEGTGLGLSITQKIVEGHGGTIRHESEKGKGTRFFVELPRKVSVTTGAVEASQAS
jgi:signal transduction histidine kinase/DNA-binding response OmpR family regulator